MRSHERIFVAIVMTFIIFLIAFSNNLKIEDDPLGAKLSPKPENFKITINLYFVQEDILKTEQREILYDEENMASVVLGEMMKGPRNLNYDSSFELENKLISVEKVGKNYIINLDKSFLNNDFWKKGRSELYIWAIVNTLTEIEGVNEVQFLVDGKSIDRKVNTYNLNSPLVRIEEYIYSKKKYPSEVIVKFLDGIYSQRYDISYDLLCEESKESLDFNKFSKVFSNYSNNISNFTKDIYLIQDFEDYYLVTFRYTKPEKQNEFFFEKWKLIFEGSELKIDIKDQMDELEKEMK